MPVKQIWKQTTRDGRPFITFLTWLDRLPAEQQEEYAAAKGRQQAYRQQAIDKGDMEIGPDGVYIWKDQETANRGKPQDPIWAKYHDRWAEECAIVTEMITEETET